MGQFPRKLNGYIIKRFTNASCLNRYYFRTVNAVGFLFSIRHATPFHYVEVHFGVLHKHSVDVTRSDTPMGFKTSTTSGRSVQIASNSMYMYR